jgi:DNA polymerase IV
MDAFFASVEQRDNPNLKGKPVAVGGGEKRGVVAAASYEARKFGVRSAMASITAKRLCPNLIFVPPRFEAYKIVSKHIREIFAEYTHLIKPLSLDEAYLDVTENLKGISTATQIAEEIRLKIFEKTGLTASAGVSFNKFLAKTASDINKPNGQFIIKPAAAEAFVELLQINKFYGIGKVTAEKMRSLGIFSGKELKQKSKEYLIYTFGKVGAYYYDIARGQDHRNVEPNRETKSISVENTFNDNLELLSEIYSELFKLVNQLMLRTQKYNVVGKTITIKIKYADFEQISRSRSYEKGFDNSDFIKKTIEKLMENIVPLPKGIRLLGLGFSNFIVENKERQLTLDL